MNTNDYDEELRHIVADYLLKDKQFIPLYKEYVYKDYVKSDIDDDVNRIATNLFGFTIDIEPSTFEVHPEVVKEYIIYRLFIYACWKRIKDKLGDNITFIDPDSNKEAIVRKEYCSLTSDHLYLNATHVSGGRLCVQLHIEAMPPENLMSLKYIPLLDYPVLVSIWRDSGRGNDKPAEVKKIGEFNKSQILDLFKW